jgi:uncharacterized protein YndB with AHSA1/START domain
MSEVPGSAVAQPVLSGSFTVERSLAAAPERVFCAYSDATVRRQWFHIPGSPPDAHYELDFRVGGYEVSSGWFAPMGTPELIEYRSNFWDIAADARIVFGYSLTLDGIRRWASLVTVEISAVSEGALAGGSGTLLRHTEQYAYLAYADDGAHDLAHLRGSTNLQLNGLAAVLGAGG